MAKINSGLSESCGQTDFVCQITNRDAKKPRKRNSILRSPDEKTRFLAGISYSFIPNRKAKMRKVRVALLAVLVAQLLALSWAQQGSRHLLSADELKKAVPTEYFYSGQKAPVQLRNSAGFQLADGKMTFAALVDASGYSTAIQQKYQGMLITEGKLNIGGSDLAPGQYGFGFTADGKFVVMNVANEDVLNATFQTDSELKRAVPLKMTEDGSGYKLYAGKKWVSVKPQ